MRNDSKRWCFSGLLLVLLGGCQPQTQRNDSPPAEAGQWVGTGAQRLRAQVYPSAKLSPHPTLLLVLHGDAPFSKPGYQYILARQVAQANPDVVAVGLLRPGYTDPTGHQSAGQRGEATGDNYTPAVLDAIAGAVTALKAHYHAGRVVLAGHSGGAAITAGLLGRHPGLADAALLAACPCDVPAWRAHMKRRVGGSIWDQPVASVSPEQVSARIPAGTRVTLVVGANDSIAPKEFTQTYYQRLRQQGLPAKLVELPGAGHELFLSPVVLQEITPLLH